MRVTFDRGVHSDLIQRFTSCLIVGAVKSTTYIKLYASVSIGGRGGGGGGTSKHLQAGYRGGVPPYLFRRACNVDEASLSPFSAFKNSITLTSQ